MAKVLFVLEDMEVSVPEGATLPEVVEATGADITFGCRNGSCGTCRVLISKGEENLSPKGKEESDFLEDLQCEPNERLGCQLKINGDCEINYIGL